LIWLFKGSLGFWGLDNKLRGYYNLGVSKEERGKEVVGFGGLVPAG